jgi:hypothetical protein
MARLPFHTGERQGNVRLSTISGDLSFTYSVSTIASSFSPLQLPPWIEFSLVALGSTLATECHYQLDKLWDNEI